MIVIGILSLSAVSASENLTADESASSIESDEVLNLEIDEVESSKSPDLDVSDEVLESEEPLQLSDDGEPTSWYVNVSAPDGGNGSADNPFNSLLRVHQGEGRVNDGDIIYIAGGTYPRPGNLNFGGVTLTKWGDEEVIFDGSGFTDAPAIWITSGNLTINGITFKNYSYAAIKMGSNQANIAIENCRFINNNVAIEFDNGVRNLKITGEFTDNVRSIRLLSGLTQNCIIDADFKNTVFPQGSTSNQAILAYSLKNCTFNGRFTNHAATSGAAIGIQFDVTDSRFTGEFTNNEANQGGAIYIGGDVRNSDFIGIFKNNRASNGSAIYFRGNVVQSNFNGNFIENTADGRGTLFFFNQLGACNFNGVYKNNKADEGGVAYVRTYAAMNNFNGDFTANSATTAGGVLYFDDFVITGHNFSGNFKNNSATTAGAIYIGKGANNCNFSGNFTGNVADTSAGAVSLPEGISNCEFTGNFINNKVNAGYGVGGAIAATGQVSGVNFKGIFKNNTAMFRGAAISLYMVENCNFNADFINNTGGSNGIIRIGNSIGNNTISGSLFINNSADAVIYTDSASDFTISGNIFLNNDCSWIVNVAGGQVKGDDNWFGNTAVNYQNAPDNFAQANVIYSRWLFLEASANPSSIPFSTRSNIVFKLSYYDKNSRKTGFYDNSNLADVTLKMTSKKGSLSTKTAGLNETLIYQATQTGVGSITAKIESVQYELKVENIKGDVNLSVSALNVTYPDNVVISLNYNDAATGKVNITLKSKDHEYTYQKDIASTISLSDILPGDYTLNVAYPEDVNFNGANAGTLLSVYRIESHIQSEAHNRYVNDTDSVVLTVILPENATGNVTVVCSNHVFNIIDVVSGIKSNGKLILNITDDTLKIGEYNVTAVYSGDAIYENSSSKASFAVLKIPSEIVTDATLELFAGDEARINHVIKPDQAEGEIEFISDNPDAVYVDASSGIVKAVAVGSATVTVNFKGKGNYSDASSYVRVTVKKSDSNLSAEAQEVSYSENTFIVLNYNGNATGTVNISLNGSRHSYVFENLKLEKVISLGAVLPDVYEVNVRYSGDDIFSDSTSKTVLKVLKITSDIEVQVLNGAKTQLVTGTVSATYNIAKYLIVTLKDASGKAIAGAKLSVNLNGVKTYISDGEGKIKLSTYAFSPKSYTLKIIFSGSDVYDGDSCEVKVSVKKAKPKITAKNKKFKKSAKKKKYSIVLKNNVGKAIKKAKVTLKVRGKTYKAKTNSKCKATFKITKLKKKGKFKAVIRYNGNKYYTKLTKKVKIKVV